MSVSFFSTRHVVAANCNNLAGSDPSRTAAEDDTNPKGKAHSSVKPDHVSSVAFFANPQVITQDISDLAKELDHATNQETVKIEADLLDATLSSNPNESSPNVFRLR